MGKGPKAGIGGVGAMPGRRHNGEDIDTCQCLVAIIHLLFISEPDPGRETRKVRMAKKASAKSTTPSVCCGSVAEVPLDETAAEALATAFAALADPARLRLLSLIGSAEGGEVCGCDLVEPIGRSQPTVSHHLKILFEAGLVAKEKRGVWVWYRVVPDRFGELRAALA
jgi:ArsR family transcriptional regulator